MQVIRRSNHFEEKRRLELSVKTESAHWWWWLHDGQNNKINLTPVHSEGHFLCKNENWDIRGIKAKKIHENQVSFSIFTPKFKYILEHIKNVQKKYFKNSLKTSTLEKSVVVINRPRIPFTLWMVVLINASWVNFS